MNNLSWLLYLAEVLPNLGKLLFILGSIAAAVSIVVYAGWWVEYSEDSSEVSKPSGYNKAIILCVSLLFISTVVPSKDTIYLIAGSEAGEAVVTSEEGKEILSDIHEVIKFQLGKLKGE